MSDPERVQVMPDGKRLPIPEHPRFHRIGSEWYWLRDAMPMLQLRDMANGYMPLEWLSCCAVAECAWRSAILRYYEAYRLACAACSGYDDPKWPQTHPDLLARVACDNARLWEAELAKAEKKSS